MASDAQRKAIRKYNHEKTKTINMVLNKKTDADIIEFLMAKENKQGYLKALIRSDMKK